MPTGSPYEARIRLQLEGAAFVREAKARFNEAFNDAAKFEDRVSAVVKRLRTQKVQFEWDFNRSPFEQLDGLIDEIERTANDVGKKFNLDRALRDAEKIEEIIRRLQTSDARKTAAAGNLAAARTNAAAAAGAPAGASYDGQLGETERKLSRTQQRIIQLQQLLRQLAGTDIDIDVRAPDLSAFKKIEAEIKRLEALAESADLSVDPNDLAASIARLREMNKAVMDVANATENGTGNIDEMTAAWARNQAAADRAGRVAQKHLAKTTLASQSAIRIIQDAPFGMMGITNNIQQFSEEFARLKASINPATKEMYTMGEAWKTVALGMISGPMAIPLVITLVTTFILSWDKMGAAARKAGEILGVTTSKIGDDLTALKKAQEETAEAFAKGLRTDELERVSRHYEQALEAAKQYLRDIPQAGSEANEAVLRLAGPDGGPAAYTKALTTMTARGRADLAAIKAAFGELDEEVSNQRGVQLMERYLIRAGNAMDLLAQKSRSLKQALESIEWEAELARIKAMYDGIEETMQVQRATAQRGFRQNLQQIAQEINRTYTGNAEAYVNEAGALVLRRVRGGSERIYQEARRQAERYYGFAETAARSAMEDADQDHDQRETRQEDRDDRAAQARLNRIAAAERRAEQLRDKYREMTERAAQVHQDAVQRLELEGTAQRMAAIDTYVLHQRNSLSEMRDVAFDAAGNVRAGMQAMADAYNLAIDKVEAAAVRLRLFETFRRQMEGIESVAARMGERVAASLARSAAMFTQYSLDPVDQARNAYHRFEAERFAAIENFRTELDRVDGQIRNYYALQASLGSDFTLEQQRELALLNEQRLRIYAEQVLATREAHVTRRESLRAIAEAMREQVRAQEDLTQALRDFRRETEDMAEDAGADLPGPLAWLADADPESYAARVRAIGRSIRNATNEENSRWISEQRTLADAAADAREHAEEMRARYVRGDVEVGEAVAAEAAATVAHQNVEDATRAHEERLLAIQEAGARARLDAEREARRAQRELIIQSLSQIASASESLYDTWRTTRERELEAEGVAEEERAEILAREGKKRFEVMRSLRVAEAVANTISAGVTAYETGVKIGGPAGLVVGAAMMAAALATGYAQVRALQALEPGGGAGAGAAGGSVGIGGYSTLNGTITAARVSAFERGPGNLAPGGQSDAFNEAANRMENAANQIANSASNMIAVTTPATAEQNFQIAVNRASNLNQ